MLLVILWLRLPTAFGIAPPSSVRILALTPFVIGILILLPLRRPHGTVSLLGVLVGSFVSLTIFAVFRGESAHLYETLHQALYEAAGLFLLVLFCYLYFATARTDIERDHRMFILCCAPGTYVALNVGLHLGGFTAPATLTILNVGTPAQLLGLVGIHSTRVLFPFANGINNFGDIAGVALAASAVLAIRSKGQRRQFAALLLMTSMYALFATDARGALLFSIGAIILVLLWGHRRRLSNVAVVIPFTTVIITFVLGVLANTDLVNILSRNGDNLITATNRTVIWHAVLHVLSHPSLTQLYGYGANGQISSGASLGYDFLFAGSSHPGQYTAHNFMLQTVLDIGYAGLLIFVLLLYLTGRRLHQMIVIWQLVPARALLGALVFLVFAGATDSTPTIYTPETLDFVLLMATCAAAIRFQGKRAKPHDASVAHQYLQDNAPIRREYQTI